MATAIESWELGLSLHGSAGHLWCSAVSEFNQKLRSRKSLALANTFSRIPGSGSKRANSIAPIIVEKIEKNARSLSAVRRPGMKGIIRSL